MNEKLILGLTVGLILGLAIGVSAMYLGYPHP
jgi:hypothetical protein